MQVTPHSTCLFNNAIIIFKMRSLLIVLYLTYIGKVIGQCPDDWFDATFLNFGKATLSIVRKENINFN